MTQNAKFSPSARLCALRALAHCLDKHGPLDVAWVEDKNFSALTPPDRAFAQLIAKTTLRRLGQIDALIAELMERPLPDSASRIKHILRMGITQLIWLETPPHAAVHESVEMVKAIRQPKYAGLVNAVLKRVDKEGRAIIEKQDAENLNTPGWLWQSWLAAYGEETCRAIARAHLAEPPLDISVKNNPREWAEKLNAEILSTGSLRLREKGNVTKLDGFEEGAWWVQDAAATLPVQLLGNIAGKTVLDLCAAPGGKTAQLATAGAKIIAVEIAAARMRMLEENVRRLQLDVTLVTADALKWTPDTAPDAILLDAPCSATGTLRRHPDVAWNKKPEDIARLCASQYKLLNHALDMLKPGGRLVYAVCSLQPEEGDGQIAKLLNARQDASLEPLLPQEIEGLSQWLTREGTLRTLPCHLQDKGGIDGFFAARIIKG